MAIDDRDIKCVAIAGLCHDLGHGPFSHIFDGPFLGSLLPPGHGWSHEHASSMLFDRMLQEYPNIVVKKGSSEARFIRALIEGHSSDCPDEKRFLFDIVSNERNSIDVDKIDYIQRDCRNNNIPYVLCNVKLLLKHVLVCNNEICYPEKYATEVAKLFTSRFNLHFDCYNHRIVHSYEAMIVDILKESHKVLYDFEKDIHDPKIYLKLDDSILDQIKYSEDPRLKKAQELLERMQMRQHYKCVGEKGLKKAVAKSKWNQITTEEIVKYAEPLPDGEMLRSDEIAVKKFKINYGLGERHPLNHVKFYDFKK